MHIWKLLLSELNTLLFPTANSLKLMCFVSSMHFDKNSLVNAGPKGVTGMQHWQSHWGAVWGSEAVRHMLALTYYSIISFL